jgi:glycine cleavage system H lipoate-binding protein
MNCPFLQEARVRYCHAASIRKVLLQSAPAGEERCSSPAHKDCNVYKSRTRPDSESEICPFLHEAQVQYCAAAPVPKPVPYSESTLMRCGQSGYRYCELYLAFARPLRRSTADSVEGIELPPRLSYTPNHMWIDVNEDGAWRVGVDAFLVHCFGVFDAVTFLTPSGTQRPAAVLSAAGIDLHITFPHVLPISACNVYLRADPSRVATAPYTHGWLFRGDNPPGMLHGLVSGEDANRWMADEVHRAAAFAHSQIDPHMPADGGTPEHSFLQLLDRELRLRFMEEFFSPWVTRS